MDLNGKPFKVVKYATDITAQVKAAEALQAAVAADPGRRRPRPRKTICASRIPLEGKTGEIAQLCEGVNGLLDTMSSIIGEVVETAADADHRGARDRHRQHRPVAAHRRAGRQPRGNRRQHGGTDQHRAPERRQRPAGQQARVDGLGGRGQGRLGGRRGGAHHGRHHPGQPQDRRHHRRDRRDRVPDQHPGAQRRGRSGARRRAGTRLRGGRRRGAQPGAAQRQCGQGDQGPDLRLGRPRSNPAPSWSTPPARPWRRSSSR